MKKILLTVALFYSVLTFGQTFTELVVPQYFSGRTAASANNARMPVIFCFQVTGLLPSQSYDLRMAMALSTEAVTAYGAGNQWNGTTVTNANWIGAFTTDATGNSGPVWAYIQPTGNATGGRFAPGATHNIRIGIAATGSAMPSTPSFVGTKLLTALDIGNTALTPATTDDGAFIQGNALGFASGKYVLAYGNTTGTGDPIAVAVARPHVLNQGSNNELPAAIDSILKPGSTANPGDYAMLIPIGANNPGGIQRIELRNAQNAVVSSSTAAGGVWPSTANTTTVARRGVVQITNADAPLPVKYTSLNATLKGSAVSISWSTASEHNNSHFTVERSNDGKNFEAIAKVKGAGNSSKMQFYAFADNTPVKGMNFYRLRQVDFDGKSELSKIVSVTYTGSASLVSKSGIEATTPNPFNSELTIGVNVAVSGVAKIELVDMIGKAHYTSTESFEAGINRVAINTSSLPDGIYFVRISHNGDTFTQKITKR
jgi:hypothetical protein